MFISLSCSVCFFILADLHLIVMQTTLVDRNKFGMCPNEDKIKVILLYLIFRLGPREANHPLQLPNAVLC